VRLAAEAALQKNPSEGVRSDKGGLMTWLQRRPAVLLLMLAAVVAALLVSLALAGPPAGTVDRGEPTTYLADEGGD
jgi:hypothetical protein